MNDYDITAAFKVIEDELIASMIRNMDRHRAQEEKEGIQWSQWQAEQLNALEKYKIENQKKYNKQFASINSQIESLIRQSRNTGSMEQETEILEAIKNGFRGARKASAGATAEFFKLNDRKLDALIKATTNDMQKAETAVLRMANDQYRKAIFNAQVYANTGAGTYEKAVDMATKDMLSSGLNCVQYANGARHTLSDYADMAIRTGSKRAYLQGEGVKRQEWGISTVIINKRGNPCPKCLPWVGKVLIDDVWSGGRAYINGRQRNQNPTMGKSNSSDKKYPLMSYAISKGLYHPRCRDSHTTYFPGISTADDTWTQKELNAVGLAAKKEAQRQYAERQADRFGRLAAYSLDPDNKKAYKNRQQEWELREYRITSEDGTYPGIKGRIDLHREIKNLPVKIRDALQDVDFKLNSRIGSGYNPVENAIYLSVNADKRERMHEIGHAIEERLFNTNRVDDLKRKITHSLTKNDIIMRTGRDSSGNERKIYLLNSDKFLDEYQSRLYISNIPEALDPDGHIRPDVMGEFVSSAVEYYFTFPKTMKKRYPDMYDLVKEAVE